MFVFLGCLWSSRLVLGNPFPPIQPGTRPLTGDILLPPSLIDALFCEIEAHASYGNEADPAEHHTLGVIHAVGIRQGDKSQTYCTSSVLPGGVRVRSK